MLLAIDMRNEYFFSFSFLQSELITYVSCTFTTNTVSFVFVVVYGHLERYQASLVTMFH